MTGTQCPGCEVVFIPPNVAVPVPSRPTRIACRLHATAPQLLEALEVIAEESELRPEQELTGCKAVARAAIQAAKETGGREHG